MQSYFRRRFSLDGGEKFETVTLLNKTISKWEDKTRHRVRGLLVTLDFRFHEFSAITKITLGNAQKLPEFYMMCDCERRKKTSLILESLQHAAPLL